MDEKKTKIRIEDLPRDLKVSREEMRKVLGGIQPGPLPEKQDPLLPDPAWETDDPE